MSKSEKPTEIKETKEKK